MRLISLALSLALLASPLLASPLLSVVQAGTAFHESLNNHDNFVVADGYGPDR